MLWHSELSCRCSAATPYGFCFHVMAVQLLTQLFADDLVKVVEDGPSSCAPATFMGDIEDVLSSWL